MSRRGLGIAEIRVGALLRGRAMDRIPESLEECQDEIRQLREENYWLRESSTAFGDLAERLAEAATGRPLPRASALAP
jgi:hypothetical protein